MRRKGRCTRTQLTLTFSEGEFCRKQRPTIVGQDFWAQHLTATSFMGLKYLHHYPESLQVQVRSLISENRLGEVLQKRYPEANTVRTDKALQAYVLDLKSQFMKSAVTPSKVVFDNHLQVVKHALGTHTQVSRVQGAKLVAKREIRIASVFIDAPAAFLKMIVAHELAHLKEREHDKAFYQLCHHIAPDYAQLEFDFRLYLTWLDS
jgi:UTP pyrophosphatase